MGKLNGLSKCILICLNQIGSDRTISATFYILKGKKSSQTIQDIHLFDLTKYFCLFPDLTRKDYQRCLNELKKDNLIRFHDEFNVHLTEIGIITSQQQIIPKLNGFKYGKNAQIFWKRFFLLTQTTSNLNNGNNRFRPIITDEEIQYFIKNYLFKLNCTMEQLNNYLYEECFAFLQFRNQIECEIFVMKLTGSNKIGLTNKQIAFEMSMDEWDIHLIFQSILHDLLSQIEKFQTLNSICPMIEVNKIGDSALKTKKLLLLNKSVKEISMIRNLKQSTVEDHIIEIMMEDKNIPISLFVSINLQMKIIEVYRQVASKKLRELKQNLDENISYFQIRLVLARMGEND